MPRRVSALAAAALALAAWNGAAAATLVVGGKAGECSSLAHAGRHDADSIDICTQALNGEFLDAHDRAGTYVNRGSMELGARLNQEAHADFQKAIGILPGMGEAHIGEGAILISQERFAQAEGEISRGLELGSEEPEKGYYLRGMARWGQDNFKGAYDDFQKALQLKPSWDLPRERLKNFHVEPAH